MDFSEFLGQVQNRLELDSQEAALTATRVTLETLAERIDPNEAEDLAAQLPEEIGRFLEGPHQTQSFGWSEFVDRVAERQDMQDDERGDAAYQAQVVMDVVAEATSRGELEDVRSQLPDDEFDDLFEVVDQQGAAS